MPGVIRRETRIFDPHPLLNFDDDLFRESAVLDASAAVLGGANEQQTITITGTPTGGNFTLTYEGATTANIAFNAAAAAVQTALEALVNIGGGQVLVTGGPGPGTPYVVTFQGQLARKNVSQMTAAHTFTGGTTPTIAVTTTTAGSSLDANVYVMHRGLIVKLASVDGGTNNKVVPWAGTGTIFGVTARTASFFDQSDISDADVSVYRGPGCVFNSVVLALYPLSGYVGNEAAFLTWANSQGNRVDSQAI